MNKSKNILHRFVQGLAGLTFVLLVAGALVTSTGSGLAVPDWPLSFGRLFPPMVGGVLYEHGHRLIAGTVASLMLALCVWLLIAERRPWVRRIGLAAFGAVCAQAVLGGLTVLLRLPPAVSVAHAGLAEIFFSLILSLTIVTSPAWQKPSGIKLEKEDVLTLKTLAVASTLAVYFQILLGAIVRHANAGILLHIVGAVAVLFFVGRLSYFIRSGYDDCPVLRKPAMAAVHLVGLQLFLGIWTWVEKTKSAGLPAPTAGKIWLSTIHLAAGALLLAICVVQTWRIFKAASGSENVSAAGAESQQRALAQS